MPIHGTQNLLLADGEVLSVQRDGDQLKMFVNAAGTIKEVPVGPSFLIFGEESGNLSAGTPYAFSFGNGAPDNAYGVAIPVAGVVTKLSIGSQTSSSSVIELMKNGVATGATVTQTATRSATASISVSVSAGDQLTFKVVSGSGGTVNVASAMIVGALA